ncbi:MAG: hypothetical protein U0166_27170 [Acidobacteriota bacterium]
MKVSSNAALRTSSAWLALFLAAACARPPQTGPAPRFFPPPPDLPRVQYLTSFTGRRDIEGQSSFNKFVVGEKPDWKIDKPYGIGIHDGKIYVCDTNTSVIVLDLKARTFGGLKGDIGPGALKQPVNISIDQDGNKYVSDPVRGQVVVFDKEDEYKTAYGAPGAWRPVDAVPFGERLYTVDTASWVVKVLDLASGEVVRIIGDKGDPAERLDRPTNLAFDTEGYLYVTDIGRFQVLKFDRDGHFKSTFGRLGDNLGHFARPKGIAVDREGHLLAVDASFNNVQIFDQAGRILMFCGEGGDRPGDLILPAKVAIDYDNLQYFQQYAASGFRMEYLILVTSQFGDRRVNVLAYGRDSAKKYPTDEELMKELEERRKQEREKQEKLKAPDSPSQTSEPKSDPSP